MRAVFLDKDTFGEDFPFTALQDLPVKWTFYPTTSKEEVGERIRGADIVVTNKVVMGKKEMEATSLKLIAVTATGVNIIDLHAASERGITVCNVPTYSTESVVQHIFTLILSLSCSLVNYVSDLHHGLWERSKIFTLLQHPIRELKGKTLAIIGYGSQGKEVEKIAKAFGMEVIIAEHSKPIPGALPLEEVLKAADIVVIAVPLTPKTKNMIAAKELRLMKPTALLINTARGGIVNEKDLAAALKDKTIAGAGFDVLTEEPPKADHPLLDKTIPNLILTPHIAWASTEARLRCLEVTRDNILAFLSKRPQNEVYRS